MSNKIQVLSEETINQIAAGEVIENPASVVKELIENSIDADASRIIIEIEGGGFYRICVNDNGKGMGYEDLLLCLERHATSKISAADDLSTVSSMGFRGEALASIAAIGKIRLISCQKENAYEGYAEKGKMTSLEPTARNPGTTVEVGSLFYNVPARRRFQKSARRSQNEIMKMLIKFALAHPFLELKCIADGKEIFSSFMKRSEERRQATEQVIKTVLGDAFLESSWHVHVKSKRCVLFGCVGAPHQTRKNRASQYLFVNNRVVESPEITRAIYEGYGTRLPSNEHPTFVLYLTIPAEWIDVNVHPQKKEIRLREVKQVKQLICQGVSEAFQEHTSSAVDHSVFKEATSWIEEKEPFFQFREQERSMPSSLPIKEVPIIGLYAHYLFLDASRFDLAISGSGGIVIVDLQAAEACVVFDTLLSRFEKIGEMQTLMFPLTFECSIHEKEQITLYFETLQQLGIAIRSFGENTFLVDALDPHIEEGQVKDLIYELVQVLERFDDHHHLLKEQKKKLALSVLRFTKSCKEGYDLQQARALVQKLFAMAAPYQSPTGKPTCVYLSQNDIGKYFC